MNSPDQRVFESDLQSAEFRIGAVKGQWGLPGVDTVSAIAFPRVVLWIAAQPRPNAPDRYYLLLDVAGYRASAPTGTFWDPSSGGALALDKRPKGAQGSRFAQVFRTDWEGGSAFYHPYDRRAATTHAQWPADQPHLVWTSEHTIVDFLAEFHGLFQSGEYLGI